MENILVWTDDLKTYFWGLFPLFFLGDISDEHKHPNCPFQNIGICSIVRNFNILILDSEKIEPFLLGWEIYYNKCIQHGSMGRPHFKHNHLIVLLKK